MTSATATRARLDSLTGIRAAAVFLVFWHHGNEHFDGISSGMVGVSLFYLLSGFVMAWTDRDDDTPWLFYRRRFARIYPAYLVACMVAFTLHAFAGTLRTSDFAALTLLQSWVPSEAFYFAGNAVFWSLSCEAFFYLVFPWLRLMTRRLGTQGLALLAGGAAAASIGIGAIASTLPLTPTLQWAVVVFPPSRLPEFVIGVALGTMVSRGWNPRIPLWAATSIAGAAVVGAMFAPYALSRYGVTLIPFAILVVALAVADIRGTASYARWKPAVTMGAWSYCFYLLHAMVISVVMGQAAKFGVAPGLALIVTLIGAVIASWLLHIVVELRAERRLRPARSQRLNVEKLPVAGAS